MGDLAQAATAWAEPWWDEARALLWNPPGSFDDYGMEPLSMHMVPQSGWYAVGLLMAGEQARAERVLTALCELQYDEPGTVWHGTFARFAEWPPPRESARQWIDYDPNWRQFVATTFSLILRRFAITADLTAAMRRSIDLAVASEPPDRVSPEYSNIALMRAWLDVEAGRPGAEAYAAAVAGVYRRHGAFAEYGSPTYYGIDLFALALWRDESSSAQLREWGAAIEASLWRDVARWYHPGLRNLCGPYSRAYGMDMTTYLGLLGLWLWPVVGMKAAPLPDLAAPFEHSHDLTMAPLVDLLGAVVPPDAEAALHSFQGEHVVEQRITDDRVATGWLADEVMFGGERGGRYRAEGQYAPATAHWRSDGGGTAWLRVTHPGPVSATASAGRLDVSFDGDIRPQLASSEPFPGSVEWGEGSVVLRWTG